tara:strand:- start:239 stop:343 length:105 start_codon:yes stop_codon:yes gene_type:complete
LVEFGGGEVDVLSSMSCAVIVSESIVASGFATIA